MFDRMNRRPSRAQVKAAFRYWQLVVERPPPRNEKPAAEGNRRGPRESKLSNRNSTPAAGERQR